jgi:hypothetical protein
MVPVEHHDARHQMVAFFMQLLSKIGCQPQIQVSLFTKFSLTRSWTRRGNVKNVTVIVK